MHECQLNHDVKVRLNNEMGRFEELHEKESQIWAKMKGHYEETMAANKRKIENLKKALEDLQAHSHLQTGRIRTLLQTNWERFTMQLQVTLDKGWAGWVTQVAELHTYRADWENWRKEGKGFYKLSEASITTVCEQLTEKRIIIIDALK